MWVRPAMNCDGSRTGVDEHVAQPDDQLFGAGRGDAVDGALGPAAFAAGLDRFDQVGALELVDGVVQGAAFEGEQVGGVADVHLALHLVGVHGAFAEEAEDGEGPEGAGAAAAARACSRRGFI